MTIEIICEWCLEDFEVETTDCDSAYCPYCRNMTRTDVEDNVEIIHN